MTSLRLACHDINCRHSKTHWVTVKALVTVVVMAAVMAPDGFATHAAIAANMIWIWIEP